MNQWIDLPKLSTFTTGITSFYIATTLNIESIYMSNNDDSDVPFINGKYTPGKESFYRLYSNQIQYDEGITFESILH